MDYSDTAEKIKEFILNQVRGARAKGVVIGLSGGIDSSLVATLATQSLGKENVLGLIMPSKNSNPQDEAHAILLAEWLGISFKKIEIGSAVSAISSQLPADKDALANLSPRMRMAVLYYEARRLNYLVLGTGNKSEISVGYFTKYGDGGCDMLPIGGLFKTEVWELARFLKIPSELIEKAPSAGLWEGQTDEGELGISYEDLDSVLKGKSSNKKVDLMIEKTGHKRSMPPVCEL